MSHAADYAQPVPATARPDPLRWRALVLLCLAQFMVILDVTVVNVALPEVAADLGMDRTALTWVVTAYTLCFGGLMILGGRLADLLGRRRVFLAGLLLFTTASLAAGLSDSADTLIGARLAQGVGAAMLSPAALSILTTAFVGTDRNRALGVWAAIGGGGAAAGVLVGGLLASGPGWEWVFLVNVPVGVAVAALVPVAIAPGSRERGWVDVPGALLVTAGSASLIYGLVRAGDTGWSGAFTVAPIAAAAVLYGAFVIVEQRVSAPLVRLSVLARRWMVSGLAMMLTASALLIAGFFLCSLLLQRLLGLSALDTGLVFLPVAIAVAVGAHTAGRLVGRWGPRPVAGGALALAAIGFAALTRVDADAAVWAGVLPGFALAAAGLGAAFVTATITALSRVDTQHAGMAAGTVNTSHELGAAFGVAVVSTIAGASIDAGAGGASTSGFTAAFWACATVAALAAALLPVILPGGPPPATDGPVIAH